MAASSIGFLLMSVKCISLKFSYWKENSVLKLMKADVAWNFFHGSLITENTQHYAALTHTHTRYKCTMQSNDCTNLIYDKTEIFPYILLTCKHNGCSYMTEEYFNLTLGYIYIYILVYSEISEKEQERDWCVLFLSTAQYWLHPKNETLLRNNIDKNILKNGIFFRILVINVFYKEKVGMWICWRLLKN